MTPDLLINVPDLEATCWDGPPPPGQVSEVIEIGLYVFDSVKAERQSRHQLIVRLRREFYSDSRLMLSWGGYDFRQVKRQCEATGTPFPFRRHFGFESRPPRVLQAPKAAGLGQAMTHAELEFEDRAHLGADDPWNVGGMLVKMLADGFLLEDAKLS